MKKILSIILLLISATSFSQVYKDIPYNPNFLGQVKVQGLRVKSEPTAAMGFVLVDTATGIEYSINQSKLLFTEGGNNTMAQNFNLGLNDSIIMTGQYGVISKIASNGPYGGIGVYSSDGSQCFTSTNAGTTQITNVDEGGINLITLNTGGFGTTRAIIATTNDSLQLDNKVFLMTGVAINQFSADTSNNSDTTVWTSRATRTWVDNNGATADTVVLATRARVTQQVTDTAKALRPLIYTKLDTIGGNISGDLYMTQYAGGSGVKGVIIDNDGKIDTVSTTPLENALQQLANTQKNSIPYFNSAHKLVSDSLKMSFNGNTSTLRFNDAGADIDFIYETPASPSFIVLDAGNSKLGLRNSAPQSLLHIGSNNRYSGFATVYSDPSLSVQHTVGNGVLIYNTTTSSATAGGSVLLYSDDNAAQASGDRLGWFGFGGSTAAGVPSTGGRIACFTDEAWTASVQGSKFTFDLKPIGSNALATKMTLYGSGQLNVVGYITSLEYNCRNYINSTGVDVTIGTADVYYTIKGMGNKHNTNLSYTDSSITAVIAGWYNISMSCTGYTAANGKSVHVSLFVDDVENTSFEGAMFHKTSSESFNIAWPSGEMYLTAGQVLKAKMKYVGSTGTYHIEHMGLNLRKVN